MVADGAAAVAVGQALTLDELRNLKFLAAENASGTSTFVFTVTDTGSNDGDNINFITETVNLDILGFNDTPVLPTDVAGNLQAIVIPNATEDTVYQFTAAQLLEGVIDPDIEYEADGETFVNNPYGDVLVVENLSVTDGTLTGPDEDGYYSYTPDTDFEGTASFNYLIKDGQGGSISNSVNLTVTAVNDAPIAEYNLDQDTAEASSSITGVHFATDVEVDRGEETPTTLEFSYKEASINGAAADPAAVDGLTINTDGDWTFDPSHASYEDLAAGQTKTIEVTYEVKDADNATATNSFTITVNGTNDDPVATFTTAQTSTEDAAVVTGQLTATDVDTGDVLKYFSVGAPVDGLNIVEATGEWTFDPTDESYQYLKNGQSIDITVEYAVEDQDGGFNESSFVITLTGTNDAPAVTGILSSLPGCLLYTSPSPRDRG